MIDIDVDNLDKTNRYIHKKSTETGSGMSVTVFDGQKKPFTVDLASFGKQEITFGKSPDNDIVLDSPIVSRHHGRIIRNVYTWLIRDDNSTNGIIYNNREITSKYLSDGDLIRIDDEVQAIADGVLFVFSTQDGTQWSTIETDSEKSVTIGREQDCTIVLPHPSVSKHHAVIEYVNGRFCVSDTDSTNGVLVNGLQIKGRQPLNEKDVITITNSKLIFTSAAISYASYTNGISVDASDVVIERKNGRKRFITSNHVNLNIRPGELVAIIGGSGAGKSTIMNALCGYLPPTSGEVYINGNNLYQNFDSLKKIIGYVPQQDIVYDNLTLYDMLRFTAKLRLPSDTTKEETDFAIEKAIKTVELTEKKDALISNLSGGQRKRASIAVELLSDPNLIFLDEPTSGLDPGTERSLMHSLRSMADSGKTIILVTHSTLQLKMCDKIVFMGKGGNLCYFGSYDDALQFFGVDDIVDIYNMITDNPEEWRDKYNKTYTLGAKRKTDKLCSSKRSPKLRQLFILSARYLKLIANDRKRLLLLIFQAPVLAALIAIVADGSQFEVFESTNGLVFALSCAAFWVGMLNSIQEVCKERPILRREYMTGLSLSSYLISKIFVLGALCLLQSALMVGVFAWLVGLPKDYLLFSPFADIFISTFLTALSSAGMGIFVSSMFSNADRAMTVAPLLLLPQILFSGLIFELKGSSKIISWITICRWSIEGLGTSSNLNDMPLKIVNGVEIAQESAADAYTYTQNHLLKDWLIMAAFVIGFLVLARIVLSKISKEKS